MKKQWYQMKAVEGDSAAEIQIIDFIGDWIDDLFGMGVTANQFVKDLAALPESVKVLRVHINSPGGDVFGAVNIANALRDQRMTKGRKVEVFVDGLAASAATLVMMAGSPVKIADNALVMVHNPWTVAIGDSAEMRKSADLLDQLRDSIVANYQWKVELSDKELQKMMDAETWMSADEAIALGFADEKIEGLRAAASISPHGLVKVGMKIPAQFADRVRDWTAPAEVDEDPAPAPPVPAVEDALHAVPIQPTAMPAAEVMSTCREAGLDLEFAAALMDGKASPDVVATAVAAERDRRAVEKTRCETIVALCGKFKVGALSDDLVAGGISADHARAVVATVTAMLDKVEIDSSLSPDDAPGGSRKAMIDVTQVYAKRNAGR